MSVAKRVLVAFWAVLIGLALIQSGTTVGTAAQYVLVVLAVAHVIEMAVFFKLCKQAGGSLGGHLANVFVFGVLHAKEMKAAQPSR